MARKRTNNSHKKPRAREERINKTLARPQDVASACKPLKITPLAQPRNLTKEERKEDMAKKMTWETSMKNLMKRADLLESKKEQRAQLRRGSAAP